MPTDFRDAAERHWDDAACLFSDNRPANADHLFGLSAECALKAVMVGLRMALLQDGAPQERQHRVHINELWDEFVNFAQGRGGSRYVVAITGVSNPFSDWDASQRYAHRTDISIGAVSNHKNGAEKTITILNLAILDGVVS
jgi:hypothetical protein